MILEKKLVLASGNQGKLREISQMLSSSHLEVIPQSELNVSDVEETGLSFVENAILKARHACRLTGLPAIADDSGIAVDHLKGEPGIYSARYAGSHATDEDNLQKLLASMKGVPEAERTARFHCVICYMQHDKDPTPVMCHGIWEGRLLTKPAGTNGFGYDPIFYLPEHQCTSAELSAEVKNSISHRGKALRSLLQALSL